MDFNLALKDILSPAGFVATAALVTGLVELFKRLATTIMDGREQVAAAVLGGALIGLAMIDKAGTTPLVLGDILVAAMAWYGITRLALGIHDDAAQKPGSLTGPG